MRNKLLLALVLLSFAYFSVHATGALGAKSSAPHGGSDSGRRLLSITDHAAGARALWGRAQSQAKAAIVHRKQRQAPTWETELIILEGVPKRKLQSVGDADFSGGEKVAPTLYETGTNRRRVLHQQQAATAPRVFRPAA